MKTHRLRVMLSIAVAVLTATINCLASDFSYQGSEQDRAAIQRTGNAIRNAFARGDVEGIMAYHHPDVIKALTADKYQIGSEAVKTALISTLQAFSLTFDQSHVDNIFFRVTLPWKRAPLLLKGRRSGMVKRLYLRVDL